jgi:hypothetical protein
MQKVKNLTYINSISIKMSLMRVKDLKKVKNFDAKIIDN